MQVTILMGRLMTSVMNTGMLEPISFTLLRSFTHSVTTVSRGTGPRATALMPTSRRNAVG